MAATVSDYKVVDDIQACIDAVADLSIQEVVAVDAEGVHLGKDGPLTLLQIAKMDDFVYIFNIFAEPNLFSHGRLKKLLENKDIVKVIHSCSGDSAALKSQYDVMLENVFDTQQAQMLVERSEGRQLPYAKKLKDVCALYTDVTSLEGKDDIQMKWDKTEGAFWEKHTLTQEMIDYACADVRVLIHDVYNNLKRFLDEKQLWPEFYDRVKYELNCRWNPDFINSSQPDKPIVASTLRRFPTKYSALTQIEDVTDEDDLHALKWIRQNEVEEYPPIVKRLKFAQFKKAIQEIDDEISHNRDTFVVTGSVSSMVYAAKKSPDLQLKTLAQRVSTKMDAIMQTDMINRYRVDTPLKHLSSVDRGFLKGLPSSTGTSPRTNPVLRHLYTITIQAEVDEIEAMRGDYRRQGRSYRLDDANLKKFKYFISAPPGVEITHCPTPESSDFMRRASEITYHSVPVSSSVSNCG